MYALLGLEVTATEQEVKRAYRRLAHIYHPDLSREPGATQRMQRINAAYEAIMRRFA
jgi:curved DNA-binding protein